MNGVETCTGCGALAPSSTGPQHPYIPASAGCWARYCALEDWKATLQSMGATEVVQDLVDAYAAQHPTSTDRRNRQSVAVHLMSLCAAVELDLDGIQRRTRLGRWAHRDYPALQPAPAAFPVTVADVEAAKDTARTQAVRRMATSTWAAWTDHHDTIRSWLATSPR